MNVLTLGPAEHDRVVLFAAGAGGDPERYRPLLEHLAAGDCRVIAPCFERFTAREATLDELLARLTGLIEALHQNASPQTTVAAVGHSIGGWAALCLAGATPWGRDGKPIDVPRERRISRLALFAPASGWFAAPGALDAVKTPTLVYAGELDSVTPPGQIAVLKNAPADVDFRIAPKAGHFAFMNTPPPGMLDPDGFEREVFLAELARVTTEFVLAG